MRQRWPERIWIVRHGQSAGNVARQAALAAGLPRIALDHRDIDVTLSELGREQASALGQWFASMPALERPDVLLVSPYRRTRETAELLVAEGALAPHPAPPSYDERLREKEFGVLDRLTRRGIEAEFPDQAELRTLLGKFYHRPPGGESWCDVILRLRSVLDTIGLHHGGRRVLIVAHQVVVLCLRYLLDGLDEEGILAIDREGDVPNCGVAQYDFDPALGADGAMVLRRYNFVAPLIRAGTPVTAEPPHRTAAS